MGRKNRKLYLLALLFGVVLLAGGCRTPKPDTGKLWGREQPSLPPVPESTFEAGQQAYLQKSYEVAASRMGSYSDAYPNSARGMEARYWQGMSLLELGHTRRGRMLLEEVSASRLVGRDTQALALRGLAKSYLDEQNYTQAEELYTRLRTQYPDEIDSAEITAALRQCQGGGEINPESDYTLDPGEKRYVVQAGSFTSRAFADRLVDRLTQNGIQA
ncbi:MAG: tetratricopeptide repeat protein, partial [Planctomycetes bacterium]|nr:tetratricopeptide repeat protein [Planctomycetota bacterium]